MLPTLLLVAFAGLLLGYLAALALSRSRLDLARAEVRAAAQDRLATCMAQLAETQATLEARSEERDRLRATTREQATEIQRLHRELMAKGEAVATLGSQLAGLEQTSAARLEAVQAAQERLAATFSGLSAQALKDNSATFLQLARSQMQGGQAEADKELANRQQAIANLLLPVQTTLAAMQDQVQSLAKDRSAAEASLGSNLENLVRTQQGLQGETAKLANALRRPEVRGQWGEIQLRNVVEYAGMQEHVDFELQGSMEVGDDRRRPDLLVKLPGAKRIAVDAKAPLRAYLEALEVQGEAREERLDAVAAQVRTQVGLLGDKRYFDGLAESPDFVVLFLPLEALFAMALERDPHLLENALEQHVILASPTTLVALLKAASYGWAQERIQANAEDIQKLGAELLERVMVMAEHTDGLRRALVASVDAFNRFAGSLETRVMATGMKLKALGIRPAAKRKARVLELGAPQAIHITVSGLPKLGVAGEAPVLEAEAIEAIEAIEGLEGLEAEDAMGG